MQTTLFFNHLWFLPHLIKTLYRCCKLGMMAVLLSACAQTRIENSFGDAVRLSVAQQTMHPKAASEHRTVNGIDGQAAHEALERYHKSFKEPAPHPSVFTIGVGGGG